MPPKKSKKAAGPKKGRSSPTKTGGIPGDGAGRVELADYVRKIAADPLRNALTALNEERPEDPLVFLADHMRRRLPPGAPPLEAPWSGPEDDIADLQKSQTRAYLDGTVADKIKSVLVDVLRNRSVLANTTNTPMLDVIADFIAPPPKKHALEEEAEVHGGDEDSLAYQLDAITSQVIRKIGDIGGAFGDAARGAAALPLPAEGAEADPSSADAERAHAVVGKALAECERKTVLSIQGSGRQALIAIESFRSKRGPLNPDDRLEVAGALAGMNLEVDRALDDVESSIKAHTTSLRRALTTKQAVAEVEGSQVHELPEQLLVNHEAELAENMEGIRATAVDAVHAVTRSVQACAGDVGLDVEAALYFDAKALARRLAAEGEMPGFNADQAAMAGDVIRGALARARELVLAALDDPQGSGARGALPCLLVAGSWLQSALADIKDLTVPGAEEAVSEVTRSLEHELGIVEADVTAGLATTPRPGTGTGDIVTRQIEVRAALEVEVKFAHHLAALCKILGNISSSLTKALEAPESEVPALVFGCLPPLRTEADDTVQIIKMAQKAKGLQADAARDLAPLYRRLALKSLRRLGENVSRANAAKEKEAGGAPPVVINARASLTEVGEVVTALMSEWVERCGADKGALVGAKDLAECFLPVAGEELPSIESYDEERVIKIQAGVRGYLGRKNLEGLKAERLKAALEEREGVAPGTGGSLVNDAGGMFTKVGVDTALGTFTVEDEAAVIRMQAVARGHLARRHVSQMRM